MIDLRHKLALVTGASSGIGRAISLRLAGEGARLALVGRNRARLEAVAEVARARSDRVNVYLADLTEEADLNSLKAAVDDDFGGLDILIHSAGTHTSGPVEDTPPSVLLQQFKVNTLAPYALTHYFLPALRRRRGHIVFINSRAGFRAWPCFTQYAATKFALRAIADGLREEVSKDGVRVLTVYSGKVATPMQQEVQEAAGNPFDPSLFPQPEHLAEFVIAALRMPEVAEIPEFIIQPQQEPYG